MNGHLDIELSAVLDGELTGDEQRRVEAHLAACETCRAALDDLKRLVRRAGTLDDRQPERDLWAGIAARIGESAGADVVPIGTARRRRFSFTVPQLAAASVALMALSAGTVSLALLDRPSGTVIVDQPPTRGDAQGPATLIGYELTVASYDSVISGLEQALHQRRGQLDTGTVRVLEQSLRVIDGAIGQAMAALADNPSNRYLNSHLQRALDRKLDVLRRAASLPVVSS